MKHLRSYLHDCRHTRLVSARIVMTGLGFLVTVSTFTASAQILPTFGGDRAGTSGYQFLKIPIDARSAALGQSVVANAFDASSLFWNPALAAQTTGLNLGLHHTSYFADVTQDFAAAVYSFPNARLTLGASVQVLGTDAMNVTTELEPFGTGQTFRFSSIAAGLTLSQRLTDLFSYGVTAKWIREGTANLINETAVLDLGIFYRVGETGIQMAVAVRNFGLDGRPEGELSRVILEGDGTRVETDFESMTPPTTFLLGFTYNLPLANQTNDLILSAQLNNPNDNVENWNLGVEYTWNELLVVRTGYRFGIDGYTAPGAGLGIYIPFIGPSVRFDYGYASLDRLGAIHRVGMNAAF